jgi:hypothetical protein
MVIHSIIAGVLLGISIIVIEKIFKHFKNK